MFDENGHTMCDKCDRMEGLLMFDKNGHTRCTKCDGMGQQYDGSVVRTCFTCDGYGYLDWIEVIVGKKPPEDYNV